jgi:hypothetical protein
MQALLARRDESGASGVAARDHDAQVSMVVCGLDSRVRVRRNLDEAGFGHQRTGNLLIFMALPTGFEPVY